MDAIFNAVISIVAIIAGIFTVFSMGKSSARKQIEQELIQEKIDVYERSEAIRLETASYSDDDIINELRKNWTRD